MTHTRRAPRVVALAGRLLVIWPMLGACSSNTTEVEDTVPVDADGDGVPLGIDCDDNDPAFAELCPTCPDGIVTAFGEHDYVLCPDGVNQADASADCAAMAGHLVKIETPEENDFLFDAVEPQVQSDSSAGPERFIGLNRIDTVDWRWHDDTLVGAYFPQNVPENGDWLDVERECIVLVVGAGTGSTDSFWHPKHCDSFFPYICEID